MSVRHNKSAFAKSFSYLPPWVCGYCRKATLVQEPDGITEIEWESSRVARGSDEWEPDWIERSFVAFLSCPECHSGTIVSGKVEHDFHHHFSPEVTDYYIPQSFTIAPSAISTTVKLPDEVDDKLQPIFRHLWNDPEACGGAVRRCAEAILDQQKVRKTTIVDGKRKSIPTHHRIEHHMPAKLSEAKPHLMALKWIGNNSAHNSKKHHTREELLEACEQLDEALSLIYGINEKKNLQKEAERISARKGKPKPTPKRRSRRRRL